MCENVLAQELVRDLGGGLLDKPLEVTAGMIAAPDGPGLGVSVNLEAVVALGHDGTWRQPELSYSDGSVAPW